MRATRFPGYWDYNVVRVEGALPAGLEAPRVAEAAHALQAALPHRRIEVEDEAAGAALAPGLAALGWRTDRVAFMLHDGRPVPPEPHGVAAVAPDAAVALRAAWYGEYEDGPAVERQLVAERAVAALHGGDTLTFVRSDAAGEPAAYADLHLDAGGDASAEVEALYCTPSLRGRGHASALLAAAIRHARGAGVRELWIGADADDWPIGLYERFGFVTAWMRHDAMLRPADLDAGACAPPPEG